MNYESKHICCKHVLNRESPILLVVKSDGRFQFMCGQGHEIDDGPELMKLKDILDYDPSINKVLNMKDNHIIERNSVNDFWNLSYYEED